MTFANFPELGRALTQQCSRAVLPEQEFAFLQRIVLVETRTLDLLDLVVPSTNSATQPQLELIYTIYYSQNIKKELLSFLLFLLFLKIL